ncbi:MAG: hypothetical protein SNJ66_04380 [Chloroherpetonaceae bacterium]
MKTIKKSDADLEIRLTELELIILCNALNEVAHGIDLAEFETRLGASLNDVEKLLGQLKAVLQKGETTTP